jgi:23S rRNA maturation mini-RNase III
VLQRIRDRAIDKDLLGNAVAAERARGELVNLYDKKLTVMHGSIEQMSRAEVDAKIKEMMKQYDITEEAEEVKPKKNKIKQIENRP